MSVVIRIEWLGDRVALPSCHEQRYVKAYDPNGHAGRGLIVSTDDPAEALHFDDSAKADEFYKQQSTLRPLRADSKPNRPLTAYTISIDEVKTCTVLN